MLIPIQHKAGPVGQVLLRRIPQERISYRSLANPHVFRDQQIGRGPNVGAGYAVEDDPDRVQASRPPANWRQCASHQRMKPPVPCIDPLAQCGNIGSSGCRRLEDGGGKCSERRVAGDDVSDRLVQVAQERLEIDKGRTAIDAVRLAVDFKLPRVTCGARYSDDLGSSWTRGVEADREVGRAVRIRQKTVSGQTVREERLSIPPLSAPATRRG